MIQTAYTPEAKASLARVPEDRSVVFGRLVENMGGRLSAVYNSMGDYDAIAIFEAPNEQTAEAGTDGSPPVPASYLIHQSAYRECLRSS
jgi:uncharacterized protein with GYD domain